MPLSKTFWTLSFSGAGHLLTYHLGAAQVLMDSKHASKIRAVAGSSSGAIAATFMSLLPNRIDDFSNEFLNRGGRGLSILRTIIQEDSASTPALVDNRQSPPTLYVCTTRSSDGSMKLFQFDPSDALQDPKLFDTIHASCSIPRSFHPYDVFSKQKLSYPDGIEIDGVAYCDGGIAAPAPSTPFDSHENCSMSIVISPISGSSIHGIRPNDNSWALPFELTARCGTFRVRPSFQNLKAAMATIGAASPVVLKDWHQRGVDDTHAFLDTIIDESMQ